MNLRITAFLLLLSIGTQAQGGLANQGASIVCSGTVQIVLNDGGFTFNGGSFSTDASTFYLTGSTATNNSFIKGPSIPKFNNLVINKSSNDVLLNTNVNVDGNINMTSGNLQLNNYILDLGNGSGAISGESETSRITGTTGGSITKTVDLNAPSGVNPGNIGIEITSTANLGTTTIKRSHTLPVSASGGMGIYRFFDINAATSSGVDATLKMNYFDGELGSIPEAELVLWNSADAGVSWTSLNYNSRNITTDFLTQTAINELNRRFTLGSTTTTPLPLTLLDFKGRYISQNMVQLSWTTVSEINTDHFEVERSTTGANFSKRGTVKAKGSNASETNYNYMDTVSATDAVFYRLKMVDKDLQYTYSKTILLKQDGYEANSIKLFPNPVEENFTALFHTDIAGQYTFNLYNNLGHLIDAKTITAIRGNNFIQWNLQRFASGHYLLKAENTGIQAISIIRK